MDIEKCCCVEGFAPQKHLFKQYNIIIGRSNNI